MSHRLFIVDVFAERPYAGNQLAVVIGADDLSDETMQAIAAETNYSETTFVLSACEHDDEYRVRLFTPAREIAFAGHPILGTAWVVRHHIAPDSSGPVRLRLDVGHEFFSASTLDLRIEQGYEIRRPSLVRLRARSIGRSREVHVGGHVIPVVQGKLL